MKGAEGLKEREPPSTEKPDHPPPVSPTGTGGEEEVRMRDLSPPTLSSVLTGGVGLALVRAGMSSEEGVTHDVAKAKELDPAGLLRESEDMEKVGPMTVAMLMRNTVDAAER